MRKEEFIQLIEKFEAGTCNEQELDVINTYCDEIHKKGTPVSWGLGEEEATKIRIRAKINQQIEVSRKKKFQSNHKPYAFGHFWRVAAILLLVSGVVGWLATQTEDEAQPIEMITKKAEKGQRITITLPDGSKVKMNSESTITYASGFTQNIREVKLEGEAYFEVVENKTRPFVVKTGTLETTVLGTTFNVNAYDNESVISITLETGKVKVGTSNTEGIQRFLEIKPGEQVNFNRRTREMRKKQVDLRRFLGWRDGTILLHGNTVLELTKTLERWYDVSFEFENEGLSQHRINGEFSSDNLQNILRNVEFVTELHFVIDGKRVQVSGKTDKSK